MGLITFVLVSAFSLLYLASIIPKTVSFAARALVFIKQHINHLAAAGAIYGCIALIVAPFVSGADLVIRLFANFLLVIMALPFVFERSVGSRASDINPAILKELRAMMNSITRREKLIGILGAVSAFLLFATVF